MRSCDGSLSLSISPLPALGTRLFQRRSFGMSENWALPRAMRSDSHVFKTWNVGKGQTTLSPSVSAAMATPEERDRDCCGGWNRDDGRNKIIQNELHTHTHTKGPVCDM